MEDQATAPAVILIIGYAMHEVREFYAIISSSSAYVKWNNMAKPWLNFPHLVDGYELIRKYKPETCDSKYQISSTPDQFTDTCAAMCDENDSCKFFFFAQSGEKQRCTLFTNCDDRAVPVPYAVGATYKKSDGNMYSVTFFLN